jgi:Kef-type K+ transport system membrane component KefB/Trk K+ transport system NAD-binding subunit
MEHTIFLDLSLLLGLTVTIAFIMRLLRQPLLIAYLVAGIVAGPILLNIIDTDVEVFHQLSELGVILLLFMVGVSLNFSHMKDVGLPAIVTGIGQVVFTGAVGFFIIQWLGYSSVTALYLAIAITFSSTIIVVKILGDKGDLQTTYGQSVLGLLVVQDVLAIMVMLFLTTYGQGDSVLSTVGILARNGIVSIACIYFFARYALPKLLAQVAKNGEFLFLFSMTWVFLVSSLMYVAGFSLEIGAIIAGVSLGASPYQAQISSRIRPLRDFFIIIFFLLLGAEMSLSGAIAGWFPGLVLALFILIGNPLILYILYRTQKYTRRNSFLGAITAAQVSEFGFVVLFVGQQQGLFVSNELPIFTIVALVTIFISSYLITYNEQLYRFFLPVFQLFGPDRHVQKEHATKQYDVILFGYHRIGWKVAEALQDLNKSFLVVDFNPTIIKRLKSRGIDAVFGDAADVEFLSSLPLDTAKLVISTIPEYDDQLTLLKEIKQKNPTAKIILNLYHSKHLSELYAAGADFVLMPHLVGGAWLSDIITTHPRMTKTLFSKLRHEQRTEMQLRYSDSME